MSDVQLWLELWWASSDDLHEHCHLSNDISDNQVANQSHHWNVDLLEYGSREEFIASNDHDSIVHAHEVLVSDVTVVKICLT